jgi:hypothetical protein
VNPDELSLSSAVAYIENREEVQKIDGP